MNDLDIWIAAEADQSFRPADSYASLQENDSPQKPTGRVYSESESKIEDLTTHQFPARTLKEPGAAETDDALSRGAQKLADILREYEEIRNDEENRARRIYRARTVVMLRRYMKYSIETGRLPSLLGQEFFRAKVTTYSVVTFEDRVIFVHDMEKCLERLDEFSRQLIARHILQEHDQMATARLLRCTERTVRRLMPVALDQFCEIMLKVGLMERIESIPEKSCQGGLEDEFSVSDCEQSENNF